MIEIQKSLTYDQLLTQYQALQLQNEKLTFELDQLNRLIFGNKSERFVPVADTNQLQLALDIQAQETLPTVEPRTKQITYTRTDTKKSTAHQGRLYIPAHIPREIILLEPQESTEGCKKIGEEVTEELHIKPAIFFVKQQP
ncbi:MAG: transposase [Bacteroidetes bacterium]|nr:transposase [Bacteroidota bacterium]